MAASRRERATLSLTALAALAWTFYMQGRHDERNGLRESSLVERGMVDASLRSQEERVEAFTAWAPDVNGWLELVRRYLGR